MDRVGTNRNGYAIYRGPRPKTHAELQDRQIRHRVDLQSGFHETFKEDILEKEDPRDYKIKLTDYDLSDFTPPSYEQVKEIIDHIDSLVGNIYIHCLHGKDRTGFICACFQATRGFKYETAKEIMMYHGFHKFPYIWWLYSLKKTFKKLSEERRG